MLFTYIYSSFPPIQREINVYVHFIKLVQSVHLIKDNHSISQNIDCLFNIKLSQNVYFQQSDVKNA